ncbi:hypothetical protein AVEN_84655-1 [Araneus ventricosus]|uniref:Uncharacterized protein n=1 Tax=Araneus ventricosus TaxID=182803 RepID=A0A4Y2HKI3_ARAVE|nr:hypothetical protein AVEN_84655-1 [Araneus ventricosus]
MRKTDQNRNGRLDIQPVRISVALFGLPGHKLPQLRYPTSLDIHCSIWTVGYTTSPDISIALFGLPGHKLSRKSRYVSGGKNFWVGCVIHRRNRRSWGSQ